MCKWRRKQGQNREIKAKFEIRLDKGNQRSEWLKGDIRLRDQIKTLYRGDPKLACR